MGQRIMVQLADHSEAGDEAVHLACTLARKGDGEVVFVTMIPVQHLGWLGTPFGDMALTASQSRELENARLTAEDYGVPSTGVRFQYYSLLGAISDAAKYVEADIVFASLPHSVIPFWDDVERYQLRQRLIQQGRVLFEVANGQTADEQHEQSEGSRNRIGSLTATVMHLGAHVQGVVARH